MNKQQIFDKVVETIVKQGGPSVNSSFECSYRGMKERKCAAGIFIKDEHYTPALEGLLLCDPLVREALSQTIDVKDSQSNYDLLRSLQTAHDECSVVLGTAASDEEFFANWEPYMRWLAKEYNLNDDSLKLISERD